MLIFFMTGMIAVVVLVAQGGAWANPVSQLAEGVQTTIVQGGHNVSLYFFLCTLVLIIFSRTFSIFSLVQVINLGRVHKITKNHAFVISWSGLRGAIAVGLAVAVPSRHRYIMVSTTVAIVFFTVFIFGGGTAKMLTAMGVKMGLRGKRRERAEFKAEAGSCYEKIHRRWEAWERSHLRRWLVKESSSIAKLRDHVMAKIAQTAVVDAWLAETEEGGKTDGLKDVSSQRFNLVASQRKDSNVSSGFPEMLVQNREALRNHDSSAHQASSRSPSLRSEHLSYYNSYDCIHDDHEHHSVRGKWYPHLGHQHGGVGAVARAEKATRRSKAARRVQEQTKQRITSQGANANPLTNELTHSHRGASGAPCSPRIGEQVNI